MDIMTRVEFHFNRLMLTLIFGVWASEPPRAWRATEKAGLDRVKESPIHHKNYIQLKTKGAILMGDVDEKKEDDGRRMFSNNRTHFAVQNRLET